jgi:hypothetical protein
MAERSGCVARILVRSSILVLALSAIAAAAALHAQEAKPKVSDKPLTAEQLAVYRVILHGWTDDGKSTVNLGIETGPLSTGASDAGECAKGLNLEPDSPALVHRFRATDLPQLGSDKIGLVDPEKQTEEIKENDPERTIGKGRSIDDAVSNAFAHGLVTLSEIRFDKDHKHAMVSYSFFCGGLCGNGGAVVLEKIDGVWKRKTSCSDWIS